MNRAGVNDVSTFGRPGWEERCAGATPALILLYFALHTVLRVTAPGGLGLDEAEQMVAVQSLEWGYGAQPPLYSWLQWLVFRITGEGKLGLALLKNALLATAFLAVWAAALHASGSRRIAMVAAFSLMLLPPIAWEAQRALSHSVLAVAVAALTVLLVLRARSGPGWGQAMLFGLLAAAGLLAKGNFAFLLAGLALALVATRSPGLHRWAAGLALAATLLAFPLLWMLDHPGLVTQNARKFGLDESPGLGTALAGLGALGLALLAFSALLVAVHGALFWWRHAEATAGRADGAWEARFLGLWLAGGVAVVAAAVLATGTTEVKERWLQPVLIALPLALTLGARARVDRQATRRLLGIVGLVALAVLIALPLNFRRGGGENPAYQSAPFAAAAAALPAGPGLVLAGDDFVGGNLRLVRPDLAVLTPQQSAMRLAGRPRLAVWWGRNRPKPPPEALAALVRARTGHDLGALGQQSLALPYPPPHAERRFHLHWAVLPPG